jgi:hypothetical protein
LVGLVSLFDANVKGHAPLSAAANVDHEIEVVTTDGMKTGRLIGIAVSRLDLLFFPNYARHHAEIAAAPMLEVIVSF